MKINNEIIKKTENYVKKIYNKKKSRFHSWKSHVECVVKNAKYIAKKEKLDVNIAWMGALLHDIGREKETKSIKEHGIISAKEAEKFLKRLNLDQEIIDKIKDTMMHHSGDNLHLAKTKEALAVFDADKLERVGPRGFLRYVAIATRYTHPEYEVDELFDKAVEKSKNAIKKMKTNTGKKIAKEYFSYTKEFIRGYNKTKCK